MNESQIKSQLKTCMTPSATVEMVMHLMDEQRDEAFLSGYDAGQNNAFIKGYEKGVQDMAARAKDIYDEYNKELMARELSRIDQVFSQPSGSLIPSAIK